MLNKQITSVIATRFGKLLVTESNAGIVLLKFLDQNDQETRAELVLGKFAEEAKRCINGLDWSPPQNPPIVLQGTDFQTAVWEELCRIPMGSTVTYTELAERIGKPTAARAVANACGRNPICLIVPCHRVVGSNGNLGGYSCPLGTEKKVELLAAEKEALHVKTKTFLHV
ncbi:unnamed protein product, partial [Mesorhabditis spiculigera]